MIIRFIIKRWFSLRDFKIIKSLNNKIVALIFLAITSQTQAQDNFSVTLDSLENKGYDYYLSQMKIYQFKDNRKTNIYARAYLKESKKNKDSLKITEAYYYLSSYNTGKKSFKYIDSVFIYKNHRKYNRYITLSYFRLGTLNYLKRNYSEALDNYIMARKRAKTFMIKTEDVKDTYLFYNIEYHIGLIKLRTNDFEEARDIFKRSYEFMLQNKLEDDKSKQYVNILSSLSIAFWHHQRLDSAVYYSNLALKASEKNKNLYEYGGLRVTEAIINYDRGEYKTALDSITKYTHLIEARLDSVDLAMTYLYQGKLYKELGNWKNALPIFKKVDTIIINSKSYSFKIKENYNILYDYYKKEGDLKNQLIYLEKLLQFDSILYNNKEYLKTTLLTKYETPKLLDERENIIKELKREGNKRLNFVYTLLVVSMTLLILVFYHYRKKIVYKKRFKKVLKYKISAIEKEQTIRTKKSISIPEKIVEEVLEKIRIFEKKEKFLNNKITLHSVAKQLGTNSNYLSKIINTYKYKNFSNYITDLRIRYAIKALKEQPKLREYTIKAIAFEIGFKNPESFTTAFYKQTGIYPSYFIKQLKKQKEIV